MTFKRKKLKKNCPFEKKCFAASNATQCSNTCNMQQVYTTLFCFCNNYRCLNEAPTAKPVFSRLCPSGSDQFKQKPLKEKSLSTCKHGFPAAAAPAAASTEASQCIQLVFLAASSTQKQKSSGVRRRQAISAQLL